jgi:diguanylate cyclase (GGDEF)-like protein
MVPAIEPAACLATAWQVTPDLGLRMVTMSGVLVLAGWSDAQRFFPGKRAFFWLNMVLATWIAATTAEHAAVDPACKVTIALVSWPAILLQPPLWTIFLYQYVRSETQGVPRRRAIVIGTVVVLLSLVALSNGLHGRFYGPGSSLGAPVLGIQRMQYDYGPMFYVAASWGYGWLIAATSIVVQAIRQSTPEDRTQWITFLVMMVVPWSANVAYIMFGMRLLGGDPTPMGFAVALLGFGWLIRNSSLFKVVPMSRRLLFTALPDPVLVLDSVDRVMDCNVAGHRLAGRDMPRGQPLAHWPVFGRSLADVLTNDGETHTLILADPPVVMEVRVREIGEGERRVGRLVQLRDVTDRHHAQARLLDTLSERDDQLRKVAELQSDLREQALRDPLTGLLNRRALAERFPQELQHHVATGQSFALVLLDIDHFKRINDSFGHAVGDAVLCALARVMLDGLRTSDSVFRVGGEEFALLLPTADAQQALLRVQTLREMLLDQDMPPGVGPVTYSAGIAECWAAADTLDGLLRLADDALYAAKAGGRNRTVIAYSTGGGTYAGQGHVPAAANPAVGSTLAVGPDT